MGETTQRKVTYGGGNPLVYLTDEQLESVGLERGDLVQVDTTPGGILIRPLEVSLR
jgi:formylmethanofuran dehydrogenase subunit D